MCHTQSLRIVVVACVLLCAIATPHAQVTTATLLGAVRDSSGAVVPGATVVATNRGTGVARETITDERGEFVLSALSTGSYSVTIGLAGFKTFTNEGLMLGSGQSVRQTFTLELGTVEETVPVAGEAPLIENASSNQAEMLGTQEVRELPVSRRNLGEPVQPCGRRQHERRRQRADERRRRRRHGHHGRRDRSELQPRSAVDVATTADRTRSP